MPSVGIDVSTPNRALTMSGNITYGEQAIFVEPTRGRGLNASLQVEWRPTPSLRIEGRWAHQRLKRTRDGTRFSLANIPRLKIEYQLTRAIFVRYIGEYVAQERDGLRDPRTEQPLVYGPATVARLGPPVAFATNNFRNDVLFSYNPIPGTVVFLGYGALFVDNSAFNFAGMSRVQDGFFMKVSYLFQARRN